MKHRSILKYKDILYPENLVTCNKSNHQIFSCRRTLTFDPYCFEAIKSVEIDKIGAAETGDNWKPPSVWCQTMEKNKKQNNKQSKGHRQKPQKIAREACKGLNVNRSPIGLCIPWEVYYKRQSLARGNSHWGQASRLDSPVPLPVETTMWSAGTACPTVTDCKLSSLLSQNKPSCT